MKQKEKITLAIEAGIGGGSISITDNGCELGFWIGDNSVSKSEDILPAVSEILLKNNIEKNRIGRLIISENPGSLTGLRVGMAIVLGLSNAFRVSFSIVSALAAMKILSGAKEVITAVPCGRGKVAWMSFERETATECLDTIENFRKFASDRKEKIFIVHHDLVGQFLTLDHKNTVDAGRNIASHMGKSFYQNASDNDEQFDLSSARRITG